jgi:putative endonuclease
MFYIYILQSINKDNLYTGCTTDLKKRFKEHNQGDVQSTKPHCPWRLIYYESCLNKKDATRREQYLKTGQGQRFLKRRIKEYLYSQKIVKNSLRG